MIRVRVFNSHPRLREPGAAVSRFVRSVLRGEGGSSADVNIVFVGDRTMLSLNRTFLRHDYQTDVLSFPLSESSGVLEGEVYVNLDQARRQAREYRATIRSEVSRLVAHGVLHLAGYDDGSHAQRRVMKEREDWYVGRLGRGHR
jgi:probable rRNA maturation factor